MLSTVLSFDNFVEEMTGQVNLDVNQKPSDSNVDSRASRVTALAFQAAGHGVSDLQDRPGILVSSQGHALKQVQGPPKGTREVEFFQQITSSDDPECQQWRELAPKFHGIETIIRENGESSQHIVFGLSVNTFFLLFI